MRRDTVAMTAGTPKPVRLVFRVTEVIGVVVFFAAIAAAAVGNAFPPH